MTDYDIRGKIHERYGCSSMPPPRTRPSRCFVPDNPPLRPDPGIFSQEQRFLGGESLTFQNPDIGVSVSIVPPDEVVRRTLSIGVTNFSPDAPAAGVTTKVMISPWGIGLPRTTIGSFAVNLGPAGNTSNRASHAFDLPLETPLSAYFVEVSHPSDRDPNNNKGIDAQLRTNVEAGPFEFEFQVGNPLQRAVTINLFIQNDFWGATLSQNSVSLSPGQVKTVTLQGIADLTGMTPSDRINITIIATIDNGFFGGLTYRLGPGAS